TELQIKKRGLHLSMQPPRTTKLVRENPLLQKNHLLRLREVVRHELVEVDTARNRLTGVIMTVPDLGVGAGGMLAVDQRTNQLSVDVVDLEGHWTALLEGPRDRRLRVERVRIVLREAVLQARSTGARCGREDVTHVEDRITQEQSTVRDAVQFVVANIVQREAGL